MNPEPSGVSGFLIACATWLADVGPASTRAARIATVTSFTAMTTLLPVERVTCAAYRRPPASN